MDDPHELQQEIRKLKLHLECVRRFVARKRDELEKLDDARDQLNWIYDLEEELR